VQSTAWNCTQFLIADLKSSVQRSAEYLAHYSVYDIGEGGLEQNGIIILCHHIKDIDLCFNSVIAFNMGVSGNVNTM
jgi:hypothetical protein